jgi:disulfide bond formation protein DsbB
MLLGAAFAFQYIGGLEPCVLCIWQRYPYGAVIVLGLLGAGLARGAVPPTGALAAVMGLAALALFTDAAIAGFHVGVEQKWWQPPAPTASKRYAPSFSPRRWCVATRWPGSSPAFLWPAIIWWRRWHWAR